jgi:glycosyltransferase involved in cell wall biosynthesis
MIHILINALAANAGGGVTYIRNVVPQLVARDDVRATILVSHLADEIEASPNVSLLHQGNGSAAALRFWREQQTIPKLIARTRADVLINAGNFAVWNSPVPQILLSRNALYTSKNFQDDLRSRGDYRLWLDTNFKAELARASIARAECTVAPSSAFADELLAWTGLPVRTIYHGFDQGKFSRNGKSLPPHIQTKLAHSEGALRLLFVSHYNYYRNFGTLIRALPLLKKRLAPREFKLVLTCAFRTGENPGSYKPGSEAALVKELGLTENILQLGAVPYDVLHHLYAACHIYVTAAYAESFAHPLVEAMACGLPVLASDLPIHREICRDAAVYFNAFSEHELANRISQLASSPDLLRDMKEMGLQRATAFSWKRHVDELVSLAQSLV